MADEVTAKKTRTVTPRSDEHQACLDAMHAWIKNPFADKRDALLKAMLAFKRKKYGDDNIMSV